MKWKRALLICVCVAIPVAAILGFLLRPRPQTRYEVIFLPNLSGAPVIAHAINDRGQVVGMAEVQPGEWHICLWDKDTGVKDLGAYRNLGRGKFDRLLINNAGQIAGTSRYPARSNYAFLFDPNGAEYILRPSGGAQTQTEASPADPNGTRHIWYASMGEEIFIHDLNNRGQIVGHCLTVQGTRRAFVWDRTTGVQGLALPGAVESVAAGINDLGQIVGSYSVNPPNQWNVFFRDPNTGVEDLGATGAGPAHMCCINNRGFIVGRFDASGDENTLSIWTRDGGLRRLCPAQGVRVQTDGLNDANCFVACTGQERFVLREFTRRTCIDSYVWEPDAGFLKIAGCLGRKDVIEFFATDINGRGQITGQIRLRNEPNPFAVVLQPIPARRARLKDSRDSGEDR